ncbi:MAG: hypothetical protein FWF10_03650 [Clostridiales bacterium]|nr:hypothetical protein [Clostridiales bacterium]
MHFRNIHREKKQTKMKWLAFAVCILFISCTLLSAAFIIVHGDHGHELNAPHNGCVTCLHVSAALDLLKTLSVAVTAALLGLILLSAGLSYLISFSHLAKSNTLFCLKVRFNN